MPLDDRQRHALAAEVESRLDRTRARIERLERDQQALFDATADAPDDEHDPEGSTIGFERAQVTTLLAEARTRLEELGGVRDALARDGEVRCVDCGDAIDADRLLARPTARTCITCAARGSGR